MSDPDAKAQLDRIAEISRNARTTWFGLIFVLLFCGVALLDVQDRDFFEYGAATQLPLLGVQVPVVGFFVTAPLLVLGLYVYLHIYLAKLWLELGDAPAQPNGVDLDRAVFPWLISDAALRLRKDVPKRPFGWIATLASLALGWLFGPVVIGAFWVRSWPYHHEVLTLYLGTLLLIALWIGWDSWTTRRRTLRGQAKGGGWYRWPVGIVFGAIIGVVGWETTEGGILSKLPEGIKRQIEARHAKFFPNRSWRGQFKLDDMALLYSADLAGAELVQMPDGWMGWDRALREYRRQHGADHSREWQKDPDTPDLKTEFEEQRREQRAGLNANSFAKADLRGANLRGAFLAGANLQEARLQKSNLIKARLEGANFSGAWLTEAYLSWARLESANFRFARMEGANLMQARLEAVNFRQARLEGADLLGALLDGANLRQADMEGASLIDAYVGGANLEWVSFKSANLLFSKYDFSNVSYADFSNAENITQHMIDAMFGNMMTKLPEGLTPPDHWPTENLSSIESKRRYCAWLLAKRQKSRRCSEKLRWPFSPAAFRIITDTLSDAPLPNSPQPFIQPFPLSSPPRP